MTTTGTLLRITTAETRCDRCARETSLRVFIVKMPDGDILSLGSRCARRLTGWDARSAEREIARRDRIAVTTARKAALAERGYTNAAYISEASAQNAWWVDGQPTTECLEYMAYSG